MAREVRIAGSPWTAKVRHPLAPLGLTIVTLGVYWFWWWFYVNRELDELGEARGDAELRNDANLATLAATLGAVVVVPPYVTLWRTCHRIARAQQWTLGAARFSPPLVFFLAFVPLVNIAVPILLQSNLNRVWDAQDAADAVAPTQVTQPLAAPLEDPRFRAAEAEYARLRAAVDGGQLTEQQLVDALASMVFDAGGRYWTLSVRTGQWLASHGSEWVPGTPPGRA